MIGSNSPTHLGKGHYSRAPGGVVLSSSFFRNVYYFVVFLLSLSAFLWVLYLVSSEKTRTMLAFYYAIFTNIGMERLKCICRGGYSVFCSLEDKNLSVIQSEPAYLVHT